MPALHPPPSRASAGVAPLARLGDRSLFPALEARAYLNHAGISPPSCLVQEAVAALVADYARRGAAAYPTWSEQRTRLRGTLAGLIGASPASLALMPNTTRGVVDIALCFPWERGDRIVVFQGEFPSNVTPWQRAAATFELEVVFLPLSTFAESDAAGLAALDEVLERGVRLVAVSAVEFQTGLRMPLTELAARCHQHGAELFVDAVQACGVVPIDVTASRVDYLACGSHKWLMGLEGSGMLYVAPARLAALRPNVAGWLSHEEGLRFLFEGPGHLRYDRPIKRRAELFEGGNLSAVSFAALEASVDRLVELGPAAILAHVSGYLDALEHGLRERGFTSLRERDPARRSGILGVLPPTGVSVVAIQHALVVRGVPCALPDGVLRFSPHWPNHPAEVPVVLGALDESLSEIRD